MAQTMPAVNIPSKKVVNIQCEFDIVELILPKKIDIKKPTHVEVQSTQLIKSPKNFDFVLIQFLTFSNIDPHTMMDVIP
jgi:hypothetical protein